MRYIDADKVMEEINRIGGHNLCEWETIGVKALIDRQPTADVVPKSEVENILDGLMKEAREIADRYEKSANETSDYDYARIEYRGCQMGALLVLFKIAELKKKYTEGENE